MKGIYLTHDYNRNPIARRILFVRQGDENPAGRVCRLAHRGDTQSTTDRGTVGILQLHLLQRGHHTEHDADITGQGYQRTPTRKAAPENPQYTRGSLKIRHLPCERPQKDISFCGLSHETLLSFFRQTNRKAASTSHIQRQFRIPIHIHRLAGVRCRMVARLRFILENHSAVGLSRVSGNRSPPSRYAVSSSSCRPRTNPYRFAWPSRCTRPNGHRAEGSCPTPKELSTGNPNVGIFVIFRRRVAQITDPMVEYDIHGQDMRTRPHIHRRDAVPVTRLELFGRHVAHAARRVIFRSGQ